MPSVRDSVELSQRFAAGESSAEATVAACRKVVDAREPKVGAYLALDLDGAQAQEIGRASCRERV